MTYFFSGVIGFTNVSDAERLVRETGGVARAFETPRPMWVACFGADYTDHEIEHWEQQRIAALSRVRLGDDFIYLRVECFGGLCLQSTDLWRQGQLVRSIDTDAKETPAFNRMMADIGRPLASTSLPFLYRGAFVFDDAAWMRRAVALARLHHGQTGENPSVGCVIVRDGTVLAENLTDFGGRPHAEERALETLGGKAGGATAYVTLEPCRERSAGTPSCSQRLIAAGVARVVYMASDPHPTAAGGNDRLREAGIAVEHFPMPQEAEALYGDFFRAHGG